eukprot:TRINITY_DN21571_c0_g1_i1.p1 TRINITY_DN21571_c0_g1~~TRINITY_DN21571_c0_g1_i1.p1  ORF type:complete len:349 (+),score=48.78 TRINITY_DN21571_c0_g1_i1:61-1107(+)
MASNFDRWEKDPFFSCAEEVQESADRMESAYRRWIRERKDVSEFVGDSEDLCRELQTALGTAKWQLEEFERAVQVNDMSSSAEDARTRHRQFIVAIGNQISRAENSLKESMLEEGKTTLPWVRLDEGERDELALFLSGPCRDGNKSSAAAANLDENEETLHLTNGETKPDCSKASCHSLEFGSPEAREEKRVHGHRRTASASADIGAWKIAVADERRSFDGQPVITPSKIARISGFLKTVELASKLKWPKNSFRKWKGGDRHQATDTGPSRTHQLSPGINACYEKSKSCLDSCADAMAYDKQLYGWLGAVQRRLQRSQYQIQYSRPIQVVFLVFLGLCLIILFVRHVL